MTDPAIRQSIDIVDAARASGRRPEVQSFFDEDTFTATHLVVDPATRSAAIIDSVLDFDQASGSTSTRSADMVIAAVEDQGLVVEWIIETHAHADHLSAAPYLQERLGGKIAIGRAIDEIQDVFGRIFNEGERFKRDGSQFDHLFEDGERFHVGQLQAVAIHVPGHTPADMAFVIGDAVFAGDTIFMPDYGTARADFPGGDARQLYRSIRRLMQLPGETRVFLCHDYKAPGRTHFAWETTIEAQRNGNVHVHDGIGEDAFVAMRTERDSTLGKPRLILPSIQVNMRAGNLPEPEADGARYLKIPINRL